MFSYHGYSLHPSGSKIIPFGLLLVRQLINQGKEFQRKPGNITSQFFISTSQFFKLKYSIEKLSRAQLLPLFGKAKGSRAGYDVIGPQNGGATSSFFHPY